MSSESYNSDDGYSSGYSTSDSEEMYLCETLEIHGEVLHGYCLIKLLGKGSFANVWLAYCLEDKKFYALKITLPRHIKDAKEELKIYKGIRHAKSERLNKMISYFTAKVEGKETLVMVFNLYGYDLDLISKFDLKKETLEKWYKQMCEAVKVLHKYEITHCDIKPDNMMIDVLPKSMRELMTNYKSYNFQLMYNEKLSQSKIKNPKMTQKNRLRKEVNLEILEKIGITDDDNHGVSAKNSDTLKEEYTPEDIERSNVVLGDFGSVCVDDEIYETSFGTQYYLAPETLMGLPHTNKIDYWALGCSFYEIENKKILFDHHSDKNGHRDCYHLKAIENYFGKIPKHMIDKMNDDKRKRFFKQGSVKTEVKPQQTLEFDHMSLFTIDPRNRLLI